MQKDTRYIAVLQKGSKKTTEYYLKSFLYKTEQQKFLEKLLASTQLPEKINTIADVACGAGSLSYYLAKLPKFKNADFHLIDYNAQAIALAKKKFIHTKSNFWI